MCIRDRLGGLGVVPGLDEGQTEMTLPEGEQHLVATGLAQRDQGPALLL